MEKESVIAVFDVGKTNKKLFLFNRKYQIVFERSARFVETTDDEGNSCDNLDSLRLSVFDSLQTIFRNGQFKVKAINFSTYGASLVHLDDQGLPLTPLYNYLNPYPPDLLKKFNNAYIKPSANFIRQVGTAITGSLNAALQLYKIKNQHPDLFHKISVSLHLPQYLSFLLTGKYCSDITSIGCHTGLWNFDEQAYHAWIHQEKISGKMAPIYDTATVFPITFPGSQIVAGIGLHDSSAALIPYLINFRDPFILISTGTWCVSMNPFDHNPLSVKDINKGCLYYLSYKGVPVKSSRVFAGNEHAIELQRIASYFNVNPLIFKTMRYNKSIMDAIIKGKKGHSDIDCHSKGRSTFSLRNLKSFSSAEVAYHQLMYDLVELQKYSTWLISKPGANIKHIFIDGGFSKNTIYMNLMANAFSETEVFAASMAQATALGAALAIHASWNKEDIPNDLIELKYYAPSSINKSLA